MGYFLAVALEYVLNAHIYYFVANLVAMGIGGLLFNLSMIDDIKNNFNSVNEIVKRNGTLPEIYKKISHSIQLHSNAKQLSEMNGGT